LLHDFTYVQDKLWQTGEINLTDPTHGFPAQLQVTATVTALFMTFGTNWITFLPADFRYNSGSWICRELQRTM